MYDMYILLFNIALKIFYAVLAETCKENVTQTELYTETHTELHTEMHTEDTKLYSMDTNDMKIQMILYTLIWRWCIYCNVSICIFECRNKITNNVFFIKQDNFIRLYNQKETDVEYVMNDGNKENNEGTKISDNDVNRKTNKKRNILKDSGVNMLRRTLTPELRINKKLKKSQQMTQTSERDQEMKEELHEMRMKILKKELEIKENNFFAELEINTERLKAAKFESEMRQLHKQIKEAKLKNQQKDWAT